MDYYKERELFWITTNALSGGVFRTEGHRAKGIDTVILAEINGNMVEVHAPHFHKSINGVLNRFEQMKQARITELEKKIESLRRKKKPLMIHA